jgi:hypothetical protein
MIKILISFYFYHLKIILDFNILNHEFNSNANEHKLKFCETGLKSFDIFQGRFRLDLL